MEKVYAFVRTFPVHEQITAAEWDSLFDAQGRLKDAESFFTRICHAGVEDKIRKAALPFVFGVYPADSTAADRAALIARKRTEYALLVAQAATVRSHQLTHHRQFNRSFSVIDKDVCRTDRSHDAFRATEVVGMTILTELLRAYAFYDATTGYLQGMNDLFVPIILTYLPFWDPDTGRPIDDPGTKNVVDHAPEVPIIFWNFVGMIRRTNHHLLLASVTEQCLGTARVIVQIVEDVSPVVAVWWRRNGLAELIWMYEDFILLFKRKSRDIWGIWLQLACAPAPTNWLSYFVAAIILETFPSYCSLPEISSALMMDVFPPIISQIAPSHIGKIALWLYQKHPLPEPQQQPNPYAGTRFDFFQPQWQNPGGI
jgi:hypothetical protein